MHAQTYLLMAIARFIPEKVCEAVQFLHSKTSQPGFSATRGLHQALLIELQEEPGRLAWLTTWDTKADLQAFLSSVWYTDLMAGLQPYLQQQPEWYWYSLLEVWVNEVEQAYHERRS